MTNDILHLQPILSACPLQAGPLLTSFRDLFLSVEWKDLRVLELPESGWSIIVGHKRKSDPLRAVLPLPLHTTALQPSSLKSIFASLSSLRITSLPEPVPPLVPDIDELRRRIARDRGETDDPGGTSGVAEEGEANETLDREMIYVAIVTSDSTVVYYKLSKGIKKPADIPDE